MKSPPMKNFGATAALVTAVAALAVSPAAAQLGKNTKAPIDISADRLDTHNADCTYIYTGSAEALQDTSRLRANVLVVHLELKRDRQASAAGGEASNTCGEMLNVEAKGNVYYVAGDGRRVHGDNGLYDASNTTVTITGDVTAVDGKNNVMRGSKMVYNTKTGEGHVEGGGKGVGSRDRPRGVFYPKDDTAPANPDGAKPKKAGK